MSSVDEPMPDSTHLGENFLKNALHVNEVEDHYRKLDDQTVPVEHNNEYSSSASCPLESSSDSTVVTSPSPITAVNSSMSAQDGVANTMAPDVQVSSNNVNNFVSCVNELNNFRFIDNVDEESFNYKSILDFVVHCKLPHLFGNLLQLMFSIFITAWNQWQGI